MRLFDLRGATGAQGALIIVAARQMSATQKVQQHPAFIQAQDKANYYVNQLDKEVCAALALVPRAFWPRGVGLVDMASVGANHATAIASSPSTRS